MGNNIAKSLITSDLINNQTEDFYNFRNHLNLQEKANGLRQELTHWRITKIKKCKTTKKTTVSINEKIQSVNLLHDCYLKDP